MPKAKLSIRAYTWVWRRWLSPYCQVVEILGWRTCRIVRAGQRSRVTFCLPWEGPDVHDFKSACRETWHFFFPPPKPKPGQYNGM